MKFGILGSGSWGTALAKILTDNGHSIFWWNRSEASIKQILIRHHNPHYLSGAYFNIDLLTLTTDPSVVINSSDCIIIAIPSAYVETTLTKLDRNIFAGKMVISAVKGILPEHSILLNDYLKNEFGFPIENYLSILGPCHAEEVAAEKLSYLTFSGSVDKTTHEIATYFKTDYLNTIENADIIGVQYAAVLKNVYAVGAGMAHGLEYGDNFLSVFIANCANEMAEFLKRADLKSIGKGQSNNCNYASSVYLGDLLVTCYSLFSRNRTFGNMIGKGYSVKSAQIEMSMVAEGYNASKGIHIINQQIMASMPIAETVYKILWEGFSAAEGFSAIESILI